MQDHNNRKPTRPKFKNTFLHKTAPLGMPQTPFNPMTGTYFPIDPFAFVKIEKFVVKVAYSDCLLCYPYLEEGVEEIESNEVVVAKPDLLRVGILFDSYPDAVRINGVDYTFVTSNARKASDPTGFNSDEDQIITPDYYDGEVISARLCNTGIEDDLDSASEYVFWEDINTAGRCWAVEIA